jgi:hypothetical protein
MGIGSIGDVLDAVRNMGSEEGVPLETQTVVVSCPLRMRLRRNHFDKVVAFCSEGVQELPTSQPNQLPLIIELILFTDPEKMLDVGVGFGKYGFLSREYLELWNERRRYPDWTKHKNWTKRIDGIEVFEKYLTPVHHFVYDNIYIGNALDILPTIGVVYDLILIIDVLEHLNYDEGLKLLEICRGKGRNILISTPKDIGNQEIVMGNPYETHRFQWKKEHFLIFKDQCFLPDQYSLICYAGENVSRLKQARINRHIGKYLPVLIPVVKRMKSKKLSPV